MDLISLLKWQVVVIMCFITFCSLRCPWNVSELEVWIVLEDESWWGHWHIKVLSVLHRNGDDTCGIIYEDTTHVKEALLWWLQVPLWKVQIRGNAGKWENRQLGKSAAQSCLLRLQGSFCGRPPLYQMMSECHITHMAMANPLSIHLYTGSALPRTCTGDPSFISSTENKSKSTTLVCIVSPEEMSTMRASLTCRELPGPTQEQSPCKPRVTDKWSE